MVWRVHRFDEIDSTNTWVASQALEGAPEGLVAVADFQTRGRGRRDRPWEAAPGSSLLCSVLLRPRIDLDDLQLGVAAVSLALRAALVRLAGVRPDLKWPNDLLLGDHKVGGVLSEVVATSEGTALVVGFGVNLTDHPPGATSVKEVAGVTITAPALLDIALEEIESRRGQLDGGEGRAALREEYQRALVTVGRRVRVELTHETHEGHARGVDAAGRLIVDVAGSPRTFAAGDVVHLRPSDDAAP
jgi:BirA family transcriptional regulator, biotin operon repressor / biotin---[acetyl-CoA-carboxylase] ligase